MSYYRPILAIAVFGSVPAALGCSGTALPSDPGWLFPPEAGAADASLEAQAPEASAQEAQTPETEPPADGNVADVEPPLTWPRQLNAYLEKVYDHPAGGVLAVGGWGPKATLGDPNVVVPPGDGGFAMQVNAKNQTEWVAFFDAAPSTAVGAAFLTGGSVVVVGDRDIDALLMGVVDGKKAWEKVLGPNLAKDIAATPDNGFVVYGNGGGETWGCGPVPGGLGDTFLLVAKFDDQGVCKWSLPFAGAGDGFIAVTKSGDIVVAIDLWEELILGGTHVPEFHEALVRIDSKGQALWVKDLGQYVDLGLQYQAESSVVPDDDGGLFVCRSAAPTVVKKLLPTGQLLWTREFPGYGFVSCATAPGGGVLATAPTDGVAAGSSPDLKVWAVSPTGALSEPTTIASGVHHGGISRNGGKYAWGVFYDWKCEVAGTPLYKEGGVSFITLMP